MREPTAPPDVIRDAALEYIDAQGWMLTSRTRWELADGHARRDDFRAAVSLAYRRGMVARSPEPALAVSR